MPLKKGQPSEAYKQGKLQAKDLRSRTPEERREIARKGALVRTEKVRARKAMKEQLDILLSLDVKSSKDRQKMKEMGIDPEDMNNQTLMLMSLFKKGVLMGDVQAIKQICEIVGIESEDNSQNSFQPPVINIISTSPGSISISGDVRVNEEDDDDWEDEDD